MYGNNGMVYISPLARWTVRDLPVFEALTWSAWTIFHALDIFCIRNMFSTKSCRNVEKPMYNYYYSVRGYLKDII